MRTTAAGLLLLGVVIAGGNAAGDGEEQTTRLRNALPPYVQRVAKAGFSGAVLVAEKDEVVLSESFGRADRETGATNTAGTVFDIGSITKQFTAPAIVQLQSRGGLAVNDPLSKAFA